MAAHLEIHPSTVAAAAGASVAEEVRQAMMKVPPDSHDWPDVRCAFGCPPSKRFHAGAAPLEAALLSKPVQRVPLPDRGSTIPGLCVVSRSRDIAADEGETPSHRAFWRESVIMLRPWIMVIPKSLKL